MGRQILSVFKTVFMADDYFFVIWSRPPHWLPSKTHQNQDRQSNVNHNLTTEENQTTTQRIRKISNQELCEQDGFIIFDLNGSRSRVSGSNGKEQTTK